MTATLTSEPGIANVCHPL